MPKGIGAVILAAGKGTRMQSDLPKALHKACGRPIVDYLVDAAKAAGAKDVVVVVGHRADLVKQSLGKTAAVAVQTKQLGSGHAVAQAAPFFARHDGPLFVLYCDTPLIKASTLRSLLDDFNARKADCSLLSVRRDDPTGYGRVKRAPGDRVEAIVEEKETTPAEKAIGEVNVGAYVFDAKKLFAALEKVTPSANKKEYYLTDAVAILARTGMVTAVETADTDETMGINTRAELVVAENRMQERLLKDLAEAGVSVRDPRTTTIDANVRIGQDTQVLPHTVIEEGSVIGKNCVIGPFARIRGGSKIGDGAVIGNFVEVVRSTIGEGTQVKHLTYLGDARVGKRVNIGAGTITANYDGRNKHVTTIGDGASIGAGTILVAPVTIGKGAKTGAGAVVTKGTKVKDRSVFVGIPAKELKGKRK